MKKRLISAALLVASLTVGAQNAPLWMRHSAISPDGKTIAFAYKGDIFTVPSAGGDATQLTTNAAYDSEPIWSPDGSKIAFMSDRKGSMDVYVMNRRGGAATRLTTNSGREKPIAFKDNNTVLFSAALMPETESIIFQNGIFPQIYEVSLNGGRPHKFSEITMEDISINKNGEILYHDVKGYEDPWRKHHTSPITRDIWLCKNGKKGMSFKQLTTFEGENRNPVWAPDHKSFYYLSEKDGTFNVYKRTGNNDQQLTKFKGNPVRFLSCSNDGLLSFGYDGELYTMREGQAPKKVSVSIYSDANDVKLQRMPMTFGAEEIAVSSNGKEVAFVHHGDVYVTSIEYKTTKQITDTPEQERSISISPDGRSIVYASERDGMWQIYQTSIVKDSEKEFTYATELKEECLTNNKQVSFQPMYSPDGKSVAYFENRTTLNVIDVKSKKIRTVMHGDLNYSYTDGDQWFDWSPDSKWLISGYMANGGWNTPDIALVDAAGKKPIVNLTQSGYMEANGKFVLGGKAMIFMSDRAGYRSHGSWGAEMDAYIMFFDQDEYEKFRMNKEDRALLAEAEKLEKEEAAKAAEKDAKKDKKGKKDDKKKDEKKSEEIKLDLEHCSDRVVRLTANSSHMGDMLLSADGTTLYYQAAFEGGYDLWKRDLIEGNTNIMMKGVGGGAMFPDKDFKHIFMATGMSIKKINVATGKPGVVPVEFVFNHRPFEEREYIFEHAWKQVKEKFYDPNIHGIDWEGYHDTYKKFLPYINNRYDFSEMLSELLGELNASHTGCGYGGTRPRMLTAHLGIFQDESYRGEGIKIKDFLEQGPIGIKNTGIKAGDIITAIDGEKIGADADYYPLLDGKINKKVRLTVKSGSKEKDVTVKAVSMGVINDLLYERWVDHNRKLVYKLSGGKIAYVHVKAMDSPSFRKVYRELLCDSNRVKDAVIVDERHNGGGWLHDDLCTLLSGKKYEEFAPRGRFISNDPFNKWTKPSCVMICEDDYSNGHGFPAVYQTLKIGKLIGTPVAGTMTAVWWERQIDPSLVFGIPQVGVRDLQGRYGENLTLHPEVLVYNTPEDYLTGNDEQIKKAVEEMLKQTQKK